MKYHKYILPVVFIAFISVTGWFFKSELIFWFDRSQSEDLTGRIVLSLQKNLRINDVTNPYIIELDKKFQFQPKKLNNFPGYSLERTGLEISNTFYAVSASDASVLEYPDDPITVHKVNFSTEKSEIIGSNPGFNERHIAWSDSLEKIAYAFQSERSTTSEAWNIDSWNVAVSDPDSEKTTIIAKAAYPQWVNDTNTLLYLSAKGLYAYDLNTQKSTVVKAVPNEEDVFTLESMYSVSKDGSHLIWSTPEYGLVTIYELNTSSSSAKVTNSVSFSVAGHKVYSPVLSPDNKHYVLHMKPKSDTAEHLDSIGLFKTETGELVRTYPLREFDEKAVFIEFWESN